MINLSTSKITAIQFFDHSFENQIGENEFETIRAYSANIIVNDSLVLQLSGDDELAHRVEIPTACQQYYNNEELQDWSAENVDVEEAQKLLDFYEIENNFDFLKENASDVI